MIDTKLEFYLLITTTDESWKLFFCNNRVYYFANFSIEEEKIEFFEHSA